MQLRRVTFEHEAAHALTVRRGGGTVAYIDIGIASLSPSRVSMGRTEWKPELGNKNMLFAAYVAGPAQTKLTVQRGGLDFRLTEVAIVEEARDLYLMLQERGGNIKQSAAEKLIRLHFSKIETYLSQPAVQSAVLAIADNLEQAELKGSSHIVWSTLEGLVTWDALPLLPILLDNGG